MTQPLQKQIANALKEIRRKHHLTQTELAQKISLSQSRLSEIEKGKGSITAEQLITLIQAFNLPLSHFIKTKSVDPEPQLQNALARLGSPQLQEDPEVLPSEKLNNVDTVISETIIHGASARLITSLVPVMVRQAFSIDFHKLKKKLGEFGLDNRLYWIVDGTLRALHRRLESYTPRPLLLLYRKAQVTFQGSVWLRDVSSEILRKTHYSEDILDANISSQKTLDQIREERDELAHQWNIVTRIKKEDFYQALVEAENHV